MNFLVSGEAEADVFCYENTTVGPIWDGAVLTRTINVGGAFTIDDLNIGFAGTHTYRGDIQITVTSPEATSVTVIASSGGDSSNNYSVLLDDEVSSALNDGNADTVDGTNYQRSATPSSSLSAFDGEAANGIWTFSIADTAGGDSGDLAALTLAFEGTPANVLPVQPGPPVTSCPPGSAAYLAVPCYVNGDPLAGGGAGAMDAFVVFPYGSGGKAGDPGYEAPLHSAIASQIGACWATSYDANSDAFYTAAVLRRHMGLGPLGLGGIYRFDMATGQWSQFLDVDALPGVDLGAISRVAYDGMPLGANELGAEAGTPNWDVDAFAQVGKTGMGGMDFSADGSTLWVMNLNDRELLEIDVSGGSPSLTAKHAVPDPGGSNGTYRPWAVKVHNGKVFVGVATDASTGGTAADLQAHVVAWDPVGSQWYTLYDFPLDYDRSGLYAGNDGDWRPWSDTAGSSGTLSSHPQPLLSDLEFDMDGSMIVSFLDRYGLQKGYQNYAPDVLDTALYGVFSGGDLLRVGVSGGAYLLENDGVAGSVTTSAANTVSPAGPGGKEFYWGEYFNWTDNDTNPPNGTNSGSVHSETAMGSIAFKPGSGEVVTIAWDPHALSDGGVVTMSNSDGSSIPVGRYEIYPAVATQLFGKGVGLGDIELACIPENLSIGNLVFFDNNVNGRYDAGDTPAEGVALELYSNGTGAGSPVATTTTGSGAAAGCYLFEDLIPGVYSVKLAASNFRAGGLLVGWQSSPGAASGDDDTAEDGVDTAIAFAEGIVSGPILLGNTSPTGVAESGKDGSSDDATDEAVDLTVDFGLVQKDCFELAYAVSQGSDDGYEAISDGVIDTGTTNRLTRDLGSFYADGITGLRFDGVSIPAGAVIDSARIFFSGNDNGQGDSTAFEVSIRGEASVDAATYTSVDYGISGRPDTVQLVPWPIPGGWPAGISSAATTSPDLSAIVQEIIGQSGWASGNALAFTLAANSGSGGRLWETFEGAALLASPSLVPQLVLCYSLPCSIDSVVASNVQRQHSGTIDPSDDTFTFDITVAATNGSASGWTSAAPAGSGAFGVAESYGPFAVSGGGVTVNVIDADDSGCTGSVTANVPAHHFLALGNLVFNDLNNDGIYDPDGPDDQPGGGDDETGVGDVRVELWSTSDGTIGNGDDAEVNVGADGILGTGDDSAGGMATDGGGCYLFGGLAAGSYYVLIPAGEFGVGEPLYGRLSSTGQGADDSSDDTVDENGDDDASDGVTSNIMALSVDAAPEGEPGKSTGQADDNNVNLSVDFGFISPKIAGTIYEDTDGDGDADRVIDTVTVRLCAADGVMPIDNPNIAGVQDYVITTSDGTYAFTNLAPGNYVVKADQPTGFLSVTDGDSTTPGDDSPPNASTTDNQIPVTVADGETDGGNDFIEAQSMSLGNLVFYDADNDGIYEPLDSELGINGVKMELFYDSDNDGDFDDPGEDVVFATQDTADDTLNDGAYLFSGLMPGNYRVEVAASNFAASGALEAKSMSSTITDTVDNGEDNDDNGAQALPGLVSVSPIIVLSAGGEPGSGGSTAVDDTIDFGFTAALGIGNLVFRDGNRDGDFDPATETGIDGVVVELYPFTGVGGAPIATTTTADGGCYLFTGLTPDPYFVHIPASQFASGAALYGYRSSVGAGAFGADIDDGGDEDGIDAADPASTGVTATDVMLSVGGEPVAAGSETGKDAASDNVSDAAINLTVDFGFTGRADSIAIWQNDYSAALGALSDPDDNPDGDLYDNALEYALSDHPGTGANAFPFSVGIGQVSGTLDTTYYRAEPAPGDVTYTLEVAPGLGSPPAWVDSAITPVVDVLADGFALVTYPDLEGELANGIARLKIEIAGDTTGPHYTPVFGWGTVSSQAEYETCSHPYAPEEVFSGTVTSGSTLLDLATSAGSGSIVGQMAARPHYIEVLTGTYEGHRFEVASATATTIALDGTAARNTLGPIPSLAGAQIALRAHHVLDDVVAAADFVDTVTLANNDDPATAGHVLFFGSASGWSTYFAYNDSGGITPQWTSADNSYLRDVGDTVISDPAEDEIVIIDPGAGFFLHPKAQGVDVLMSGVVRTWDFACPLAVGYNFVGSAYPADQSPSGRDMSLSYFTGTADPYSADQFEFWLSDGATIGVEAYESHFRVLSGSYDHWTTQENSSLASENGDLLFEIQRGSFIKSVNGNDKSVPASVWVWPVPWAP